MDFKGLLFLIYRMMPFMIVSFLVISSLFSGELSGFLLLVGIMLSSLITIGISHMPFLKENTISDKMNEMMECSLLTLNDSVLSYLPLSTHTFAFIFGYFIYILVTNKLFMKNGLLIAMNFGLERVVWKSHDQVSLPIEFQIHRVKTQLYQTRCEWKSLYHE